MRITITNDEPIGGSVLYVSECIDSRVIPTLTHRIWPQGSVSVYPRKELYLVILDEARTAAFEDLVRHRDKASLQHPQHWDAIDHMPSATN